MTSPGAALPFVVFGALITLEQLRFLYLGLRSSSWGPVMGTIEAAPLASVMVMKHAAYGLNLQYHYSFRGKTYTGRSMSFAAPFGASLRSATIASSRYAHGQEVTVYVNPENPSQSVLEPGVDWSTYLRIAVGGGVLWAGLATWGST
jgi:hypothetical protein